MDIRSQLKQGGFVVIKVKRLTRATFKFLTAVDCFAFGRGTPRFCALHLVLATACTFGRLIDKLYSTKTRACLLRCVKYHSVAGRRDHRKQTLVNKSVRNALVAVFPKSFVSCRYLCQDVPERLSKAHDAPRS